MSGLGGRRAPDSLERLFLLESPAETDTQFLADAEAAFGPEVAAVLRRHLREDAA